MCIRDSPSGITSHIDEAAAHFAKDSIKTTTPFSLHTEYSAGIRKPSSLTQRFPIICDSYERGIPLLWTSEAWAAEFASFVDVYKRQVLPCIGIYPDAREYSLASGYIPMQSPLAPKRASHGGRDGAREESEE